MEIHVHLHNHADRELICILKELSNQNIKIMATIQELTAKVDNLQEALNAEQEQIAAAIAKLQATIEELESGSGNGTEEERQALADKLDAVLADLKSTVPDEEEPQP